MELSVAVDDFERFILENKRGWERIETALDKIIDDHSTKNDITFQVKSNLECPIYRVIPSNSGELGGQRGIRKSSKN